MARINPPKNLTVVFIGIFALALIIILAGVYWVIEIRKGETIPPSSFPPAGTITAQEIQEALLKKADSPPEKLFSEKEISRALDKKVPTAKRLKPLSQEEIEKVLNEKIIK